LNSIAPADVHDHLLPAMPLAARSEPGDVASTPLVRIGVIGGGLMGREAASALARWFTLLKFPVRAELRPQSAPDPASQRGRVSRR
jgi:hypothetical protein